MDLWLCRLRAIEEVGHGIVNMNTGMQWNDGYNLNQIDS